MPNSACSVGRSRAARQRSNQRSVRWTALSTSERSAPAAGQTLRGDFGVTYGDPAGKRTRLRNYWSNQHVGIVDDAVFELMLEPKHWGELSF